MDYENYSYLRNIEWKENNVLEFETMLTYSNAEVSQEATVTYNFDEKKMSVKYNMGIISKEILL